ncbi:MAG: DDE transposase, partial [Actinophytocola sp.]|nr:DDE transposase [Actinophytocola sp.]
MAAGKGHHVARQANTDPASGSPPHDASAAEAMRHRLRTSEGAALYKKRGATVEPVNGHIKDRIGLRRFA